MILKSFNLFLCVLGLSMLVCNSVDAASGKATSSTKSSLPKSPTFVTPPFGVSPTKENPKAKEIQQRQLDALRTVSSSGGAVGGRGPAWSASTSDDRPEIQYGKTFERHELTGSSSTYMGVIDFTSKDPHQNNRDTASQGACRSPIPLNRFASQNRAAPNKSPDGSGEDKTVIERRPAGKAPPAIPEKLRKALKRADPKGTSSNGMGAIKK